VLDNKLKKNNRKIDRYKQKSIKRDTSIVQSSSIKWRDQCLFSYRQQRNNKSGLD